MERIRDESTTGDPTVAHAVELLNAARLPEASEARADAIWNSLDRPRHRWTIGVTRLRFAIVAIVLVGFVSLAIAGLAIAERAAERWLDNRAAKTNGEQARRRDRATGNAPEMTPPPATPATPATLNQPATEPSTKQSQRVPSHKHATDDPAIAVRATPWSPEVDLVVDAVNALRRDHDPARAAMVLTFYLDRYPTGTLAEEALALAIEAANAEHRAADAASLGRRYLERYPQGRFRSTAERSAGVH